MYNLTHPDGGQIAISLITEDYCIWMNSLYSSGNSWSTSMRTLTDIKIEIVISKYSTSHRGHTNHPFTKPHLIHHFTNKTMDNTVAAARTIVEMSIF
jgi:hypothetical protein